MSYNGNDERYLKGTNFNELYALYLFDRELRSLFLKYILQIENNVKSVLAHKFSERYGHDNYLKVENFNTSLKPNERKSRAQKVGEIADLITGLQHEIARQLSKNNCMVSHYMLEYGYVPLWVLVNTLTLGSISKFYAAMKQQDQNAVGLIFKLRPDELTSILFVLSIFRNACAHDERLYSLKSLNKDLRPNMIKTNNIHKKLQIPCDNSGNPIQGKNDLFAIVIIFKLILSKADFDIFCSSTKEIINSLSKQLFVISTDDVLHEMGFPDNWVNIQII